MISLLNIAWYSLLLSVIGWGIVAWCIKDARRRAWTAAIAVWFSFFGPFMIALRPTPPAPTPAPSWRPDWKIKVTAPEPALPVAIEATQQPPQEAALPTISMQGLWLAGSLLFACFHVAGTVRAWRWRKQLEPSARPGVYLFEGEGSPCVVGLARPVIAVSKVSYAALTPQQWRWLQAHEGEHIRGHDTVVAWIWGWLRAWGWWNPFVHLMIDQWAQAREEMCDAVAVNGTPEGEAYADFLLTMAAASPANITFAMAASRPARRLRARVLALLDGRPVCERVGKGFIFIAWMVICVVINLVGCSGVEEGSQPGAPNKWVTSIAGPSADANKIRTWIVDVPDEIAKMLRPNGKSAIVAPGVKNPAGTKSEYDPATQKITITHTEADFYKILASVDKMVEPMPNAYIQMKMVEGPRLFGDEGEALTATEYDTLLHSLAQIKGLDLLSSPSVTTKMTMRAMISVGSERPDHPEDFCGIRVEMLPSPAANGGVKVEGIINVATDAALSIKPTLTEHQIDWSKVKKWQKAYTMIMKHGETRAINIGETIKGRYVTAFVTVRALNRDGKDAAKGFVGSLGLRFKEVTTPATTPPPSANATPAAEANELSIHCWIVEATAPMDQSMADFIEPVFNFPENNDFSPRKKTRFRYLEDPAHLAPDDMFLSGIFTDPQFQVVIRSFSAKRSGIDVTTLPEARLRSGQTIQLKSSDAQPPLPVPTSYDITPAIASDQRVVDLAITAHRNPKPTQTAVTIWDGQVVVMAQVLDQDQVKKTKRLRLLFIQAKKLEGK